MYDLTGGTQDDGDEELPGKCLEIARDIMRKKFQYQADQNAVVKSKKQQQKGTKKTKSKCEAKEKRTTRTKRKLIVAPPKEEDIDNIDIDALFGEPPVSYRCVKCAKSLSSLQKCFGIDL